jgi:hypothetical protein
MILEKMADYDFVTLLVLVFLCVVFFLINGIMILVSKNTNIIAKDRKFNNPEGFSKIYGWTTIVFSALMIAQAVISIFMREYEIAIFLIMGITAATLIVIQFLLINKYSVRIIKKK